MNVTLLNGQKKKLDKLLPEEYLSIDDKKTIKIEAQLQEIAVRYYRSYIQPIFKDSVLIVNPFAESEALSAFDVGKGNRVGFEKSQPDMIFHQYKEGVAVYYSLCLELKKIGNSGLTRDKKPTSKHTKDQYEKILKLRKNGSFACFSVGSFETIYLIKTYFSYEKVSNR